MAAPRITSYWDTYGCDKCDNYDLYVLTTNNGGTKADFATWFVPHTKGAPTVFKGEGGEEFDTQLGNGGYALPEYLISPDRSFIRVTDDPEPGSEFFTSRGMEEHTCKGEGISNPITKKSCAFPTKPTISSIARGTLTMQVVEEETYSVTLFTANGRAIPLLKTHLLSAGTTEIELGEKSIAAGMYCAEIKSSCNVFRQIVRVE